MYENVRQLCLAGLAGLSLAGCASTNPRPAFQSVRDDVRQRTGERPEWSGYSADAAALRNQVDDLLAQPLTADSAVRVALLNNATLQATYQNLGIAQADVVQAGLLKNPVLSFEMRFPNRPHYPVELNLDEQFVDLLLMPRRKRLASLNAEAVKVRVTQEVIDIAAETRKAFYRQAASQQLLEVRRQVSDALAAAADAARRLHDAGNTRDLDYDNQLALLTQAKMDVADAAAQVAQDRESLDDQMGTWGRQTSWTLAARLPDAPAEEMPLQDLESKAVASRLDLAAARLGVETAARTLGITNVSALFSGGSLGAHLQRDADVKTTIGPNLALPLPLFDQGQAAHAGAVARLRQAQANYQALAVHVRVQLRQARDRMTAARERALYLKNEVVPLRHKITEESQVQYNGMFVSVFGLLQARQAEIDAGSNYVAALRDYWLARSDLERILAGGNPLDNGHDVQWDAGVQGPSGTTPAVPSGGAP